MNPPIVQVCITVCALMPKISPWFIRNATRELAERQPELGDSCRVLDKALHHGAPCLLPVGEAHMVLVCGVNASIRR